MDQRRSKIPGLPKGIWVSEVVPSRFDEGTVYATFDGHRQNDFNTYIYVSHDFGSTWQSAAANLKDEVIKTMTEDQQEPGRALHRRGDGTVHVDRPREELGARQGQPADGSDRRDHAASARQRDDPRDARARDLDPRSPRADPGVRKGAGRRRQMRALFTPPPFAMFRRPARDRNYEFWGDQTFFGENPPAAAVISWLNKKPVGEVKLKITDAAGREVREISGTVLANSNKAGIQLACWDLRVQPIPRRRRQLTATGAGGRVDVRAPAPRAQLPEGDRGNGARAAGGQSVRRRMRGARRVRWWWRRWIRRRAEPNGPYVIGGVYTIALIVDGKTIETRPLRVNEDPDVVLTAVERKRMFDQAMEIHALQGRILEATNAFGSLNRQMRS